VQTSRFFLLFTWLSTKRKTTQKNGTCKRAWPT
jgi:hypothetical protein